MPTGLTILSSLQPTKDFVRGAQNSAAYDSWMEIGRPVLFNKPEAWMNCRTFTPFQDPPCVKEMLTWFSNEPEGDMGDVFALVNGDIILTKDALGVLKIGSSLNRVWAATSFRHEIHEGKINGVVDQGLDFFCSTRMMATRIVKDIPYFMTLGRGGWDNWMNGWFHHNLQPQRYFDLTDWECVIHPRHDRIPNRLTPYTDEQVKQIHNHPKIIARGIPSIKYAKQT